MWFCCFTFFFWPYQVACGILVPWPGIKPVPPSPGHWKHSLNLCTAREVPVASFFFRFIYFFLAALGLASWAEAFSSWGGYTLFAVLQWLFLSGGTGSGCMGFSGCSARAQLFRGRRDLPGPGIKLVSCALAGGLSATGPPGKFLVASFEI